MSVYVLSSSYLQLLEVLLLLLLLLLLHLLLCYNERLVLNLVDLFRGAVRRLNLRHYPRRQEQEQPEQEEAGEPPLLPPPPPPPLQLERDRGTQLRSGLLLQLLASRQALLSVGEPACLLPATAASEPYFACLDSVGSAQLRGRSGGW